MTEQYGPQYQPPQRPPQDWIRQQVPPPPPPKTHTARNVLLGALGTIVALAVIFTAVVVMQGGDYWGSEATPGAPASEKPIAKVPQTLTVMGGVSVPIIDDYYSEGDTCVTDGGYSDIRSSIQITISNATGEQVGFAPLQEGVITNGDCRFPFIAAGVPTGESVYTFELNNRGTVSYHEEDLTNTIELQFGK